MANIVYIVHKYKYDHTDDERGNGRDSVFARGKMCD